MKPPIMYVWRFLQVRGRNSGMAFPTISYFVSSIEKCRIPSGIYPNGTLVISFVKIKFMYYFVCVRYLFIFQNLIYTKAHLLLITLPRGNVSITISSCLHTTLAWQDLL